MYAEYSAHQTPYCLSAEIVTVSHGIKVHTKRATRDGQSWSDDVHDYQHWHYSWSDSESGINLAEESPVWRLRCYQLTYARMHIMPVTPGEVSLFRSQPLSHVQEALVWIQSEPAFISGLLVKTIHAELPGCKTHWGHNSTRPLNPEKRRPFLRVRFTAPCTLLTKDRARDGEKDSARGGA